MFTILQTAYMAKKFDTQSKGLTLVKNYFNGSNMTSIQQNPTQIAW